MAQASSAQQREPSMEEILASIRRIIEENDAADRGNVRLASRAEPAHQRAVVEVEAFRAEADPEAESEPQLEAAPRQKPLLEEIQAQLVAEAAALQSRWTEEDVVSFAERMAAAERSSYARSPDDIAQAIENSRAAREDARALLGIPEPANTARAPERHAQREPARQEAAFAPHAEPDAPVVQTETVSLRAPESAHQSAHEPTHHLAHEPARQPAPEPVAERIAPIATQAVRTAIAESVAAKPTLMSERVERQVAASFSELSEAFVERSRKTFDEIAEQMIAPLLRDWMENNLPTLVERMVREEIERVARGAQ